MHIISADLVDGDSDIKNNEQRESTSETMTMVIEFCVTSCTSYIH